MISVSVGPMRPVMEEIEGDIAGVTTAAMKRATRETVLELRDQVRSSGLGNRLANTWRDEVYPSAGRSLTPAGYMWSNAPDIVDAFSRGAQIVPISGQRFLAIPTNNVPRVGGRRGASRLMTPVEVQGAFNQELFFKRGKAGRVLAFVNAVGARSGRGHRRQTAGRASQGRQAKPVLMFVLVPTVRLPKLLDLDGPARRGVDRFASALDEGLSSL